MARAYKALVFCAVETVNLSKNPDALQAMKADSDAYSLHRLVDFVGRHRISSSEKFIGSVAREWVLLRHFEVVASRSLVSEGKNRFGFVVGDYGLERFDKSARLPEPAFAADKLDRTLPLCKQAGLLAGKDEEYRLKRDGRRWLASQS